MYTIPKFANEISFHEWNKEDNKQYVLDIGSFKYINTHNLLENNVLQIRVCLVCNDIKYPSKEKIQKEIKSYFGNVIEYHSIDETKNIVNTNDYNWNKHDSVLAFPHHIEYVVFDVFVDNLYEFKKLIKDLYQEFLQNTYDINFVYNNVELTYEKGYESSDNENKNENDWLEFNSPKDRFIDDIDDYQEDIASFKDVFKDNKKEFNKFDLDTSEFNNIAETSTSDDWYSTDTNNNNDVEFIDFDYLNDVGIENDAEIKINETVSDIDEFVDKKVEKEKPVNMKTEIDEIVKKHLSGTKVTKR